MSKVHGVILKLAASLSSMSDVAMAGSGSLIIPATKKTTSAITIAGIAVNIR